MHLMLFHVAVSMPHSCLILLMTLHAIQGCGRQAGRGCWPGGVIMRAHASVLSCACAGVLFVIQGCGQQKLAKNWGDGLATDPAVIASMGLSDPNPFFAALLQKPYLSQARRAPEEAARADTPCTCSLHLTVTREHSCSRTLTPNSSLETH